VANSIEEAKRLSALKTVLGMERYKEADIRAVLLAAEELGSWIETGPGKDTATAKGHYVVDDRRVLSIDTIPDETLILAGKVLISRVFTIQKEGGFYDPLGLVKETLDAIWKDVGVGIAGE
jgi:hypothetical protein